MSSLETFEGFGQLAIVVVGEMMRQRRGTRKMRLFIVECLRKQSYENVFSYIYKGAFCLTYFSSLLLIFFLCERKVKHV